jgi:hypothetical protein
MKLFRTTTLTLLILLIASYGSLTDSHAQTLNQAGLVVEFGNGSLYTDCIAFEGESISGYDLLVRSGLSLETAIDPSQGVAICKIESDGCPADDCFCQMPEYWAYWNLVDSTWSYAGSGSSLNRVGDGDVDGWSWGTGSPPPVVTFNQLCAPPPPPPTDTLPPPPTSTNTAEPQPSDTPEPEPTDTFIPPTYTAEPSQTVVTPSITPSPSALQISATSSATHTSQAIQQAGDAISDPSPTGLSKSTAKARTPAPTKTEKSPISPTPKVKAGAKHENKDLIGYAVFGALLVGLGLTLTRIILKGRKP